MTSSTNAEVIDSFEWRPTDPADERVAISAHEGIRHRAPALGAIIIGHRLRFRHKTPYYRASIKKELLSRESSRLSSSVMVIVRAMLSGESDSIDSRIGKAEE